MRIKEEIPSPELLRHAPRLRELVEVLCASASFKTSPKSCQFLRHVTENTLSGNSDALKERLIGITLLGRSTSYDTGADAGVRVRANDVRKRLAAYAEGQPEGSEFSLELPPGSYVPRFYRRTAATDSASAPGSPPLPNVEAPAPVPIAVLAETRITVEPHAAEWCSRLSLYRLSGPAIVALFLCMMFMRWQMNEEHPADTVRGADPATRAAVAFLSPGPTPPRHADSRPIVPAAPRP